MDKEPSLSKHSSASVDEKKDSKKEAVKGFVHDVTEGELKSFDVTTSSGFIKELLVRIQKVDVSGLGSQLAYFFLFSLFPLLIFLFTLVPYLNLNQEDIFSFIHEFAPESVASLIENTVGEVLTNRNTGLLSIGAIATIWSASKGMDALTKALNRSYFKEESRSFIVARGMSLVFTVLLVLVIFSALILPVFGQQIGMIIFSYLGLEDNFATLWTTLRWVLPYLLILIVFTVIYWVVPNAKVRLRDAIPGSVFATIGWVATSLGFSYYVGNFSNYSNTYGSIGTVIVLMMWLYFSAIILILGGLLNAVVGERTKAIEAKKKSHAVGS